MMNPDYKQSHFVALKCGCLINEISGELHHECMPHGEVNFMQ